jgi:hypothetical protein
VSRGQVVGGGVGRSGMMGEDEGSKGAAFVYSLRRRLDSTVSCMRRKEAIIRGVRYGIAPGVAASSLDEFVKLPHLDQPQVRDRAAVDPKCAV